MTAATTRATQALRHPHPHPRRHETGLMSTPGDGDSDSDKIKWSMQAQRAIDVQFGQGKRVGGKRRWGRAPGNQGTNRNGGLSQKKNNSSDNNEKNSSSI